MLEVIHHCYFMLKKFEEETFYLKELMLLMKTSGEQFGREFACGIKLRQLCLVYVVFGAMAVYLFVS